MAVDQKKRNTFMMIRMIKEKRMKRVGLPVDSSEASVIEPVGQQTL